MCLIQIDEHGFKYYKTLPSEYIRGKSSMIITLRDDIATLIEKIDKDDSRRNKFKREEIGILEKDYKSYHIKPQTEFLLYSELQDRYDICISTEHNSRYTDMMEWKEFIKPWIKEKRFYLKIK